MAKLYQHVRTKRNDLGNRMTVPNCEKLIQLYQKARAAGCSHAKACSFAISTRKMGACHSGSNEWERLQKGPDPKKMRTYKWWTNSTTVNTSAARFKSLLVKSLGAMPGLEAKDIQGAIVTAVKEANHPLYEQAVKAATNIKAVLGKRFRYNIWYWLVCSKIRREWVRVKRGKDLFIKGWGAFDIGKVEKELPVGKLPPVKEDDDDEPDWDGVDWGVDWDGVEWKTYHWAIPSVLNIQAKGYGIAAHHLEKLQSRSCKWAMEYITRHKGWWFNANNRRRVDELFTGGHWIGRGEGHLMQHCDYDAEVLLRENPNLRPEELLARVAELVYARQEEAYAGNDLHFEGSFDWVKELPALLLPAPRMLDPRDTALASPVPLGSQLVPLRSGEECKDVGKQLHNCVANYGLQIARKDIMLVALVAPDGKPLGVGECWWDEKAKRLEWGERLGPCNEELEPTVEALFDLYTPIASGACWTKERPRLEGKVALGCEEPDGLVIEGSAVEA